MSSNPVPAKCGSTSTDAPLETIQYYPRQSRGGARAKAFPIQLAAGCERITIRVAFAKAPKNFVRRCAASTAAGRASRLSISPPMPIVLDSFQFRLLRYLLAPPCCWRGTQASSTRKTPAHGERHPLQLLLPVVPNQGVRRVTDPVLERAWVAVHPTSWRRRLSSSLVAFLSLAAETALPLAPDKAAASLPETKSKRIAVARACLVLPAPAELRG